MASWVLQSRSLPSRVWGSLSSVRHNTSCLTPPTFMQTRRLSAFDLMIMKGSGGKDDMERECALCCCKLRGSGGGGGGRGGEDIGKGAYRTSLLVLPPPPPPPISSPPPPPPPGSPSSQRTPTPSPSLSPTMDGTSCLFLGCSGRWRWWRLKPLEMEACRTRSHPPPDSPLLCRIVI